MLSVIAYRVCFLGCISSFPLLLHLCRLFLAHLPLSFTFFVCQFWGRVLPRAGWPWTQCESLFCAVITGVCTCSSSFFCPCDKTHWPKALLRKVRARAWARAIAGHWGLACSLSRAQQSSASSHTAQPPTMGCTYLCHPLLPISSQGNALVCWRQSFSWAFLSLGGLWRCIRLIIKTNHHTIPSSISISWVWVTSLL